MSAITMTGPIILSAEDSAQLRQNLLNPSEEYIDERRDYFDRLAESMTIRSEGRNSSVEFEGLDLSNLDAIIDAEIENSVAKKLEEQEDYVSVPKKTSFVSRQLNQSTLVNAFCGFVDSSVTTGYFYSKKEEQTEMVEWYLAEAS